MSSENQEIKRQTLQKLIKAFYWASLFGFPFTGIALIIIERKDSRRQGHRGQTHLCNARLTILDAAGLPGSTAGAHRRHD